MDSTDDEGDTDKLTRIDEIVASPDVIEPTDEVPGVLDCPVGIVAELEVPDSVEGAGDTDELVLSDGLMFGPEEGEVLERTEVPEIVPSDEPVV